MNEEFAIREAGLDDVPLIALQRRRMFEAMWHPDPALLDLSQQMFVPWVRRRFEEGSYRGWFLERSRAEAVAGAGLWLQDCGSTPRNPSGRRAYVKNVFTEEPFRGRGCARRLMETILAWCRKHDYARVELHASDFGRPLYESLGFKATNWIRLTLD